MVAKGFRSRTNLSLLYASQEQNNPCVIQWAFYPGKQRWVVFCSCQVDQGLAGGFFSQRTDGAFQARGRKAGKLSRAALCHLPWHSGAISTSSNYHQIITTGKREAGVRLRIRPCKICPREAILSLTAAQPCHGTRMLSGNTRFATW